MVRGFSGEAEPICQPSAVLSITATSCGQGYDGYQFLISPKELIIVWSFLAYCYFGSLDAELCTFHYINGELLHMWKQA